MSPLGSPFPRASVARHRPVLGLAVALAAGAGLSACGGSSSDGGGDAATRPYTDARGREVMVPKVPKRVVTLSEPTLDAAVALGAKPIATTAGRGQGTISAYLQPRTRGLQTVGVLGQPNVERIAALKPDAILIDGTVRIDDATVKQLERFAPAVFVSKTGEDWKVAFRHAADVLGRRARATELLRTYDARVTRIRAKLGRNARARVSVVRWGGTGLPAVVRSEVAAGRVLSDLGLRRPAFQAGRGPGHSVPVSLERIEALDGDWLFLGALGVGGGSGGGVSTSAADAKAAERAVAAARRTPGFTDLRASRAGRVVPVDGSAWTSAGGWYAEQVILDDVERTMAGGRAR
ncbi:iron-siderophore ABC transporter substrate-binding protein [Patulibacter sp. NPDC049589]|uniref:iron-siderophore ABC transporter substrate-binding protein n=1 Tax=Patulibacter sp. NPDC049589 TaxID=3154731 RepID=UPI003448009E